MKDEKGVLSDGKPRREKENMTRPQEEFIDAEAVPSHPRPQAEKSGKPRPNVR